MHDKVGDVPVERTGSLRSVFGSFLKIGFTSFGGSAQALMHREVVERHKWLDDTAFMAGLAIAQVLPGANPVNLALYLGLKVRGTAGAVAAVLGMVIPAFCIIMLMGFAYRKLSGFPVTHFVLGGVAAAGVGATLSVGTKVAAKLPKDLVLIAIALAIFVTVGILKWPMVPVVLVAVPLSIGFVYVSERGVR
jgi:chromate transporter